MGWEIGLTNLTGIERAIYVKDMFGSIAARYDLMNRLMTIRQDVRWRREVIGRAQLTIHESLLDLGAGTGDLAAEAKRQCPGCHVVAADFSLLMMHLGQARQGSVASDWSAADALHLPFPSCVFDAVVSGFLLRNLTDLQMSLVEQYRVLKPGGRMAALDTTPPLRTPLAPLIRFHMHTIIPILGSLVTGKSEAYRYLSDSTENFLEPERLAGRIISAGFKEVGFVRLMFGTVAIYWGTK